jgi:hypothetical protein
MIGEFYNTKDEYYNTSDKFYTTDGQVHSMLDEDDNLTDY